MLTNPLGGQVNCLMPSVDVYAREDDKLTENWITLDFVHWLKDQGLDVFKRTTDILNPKWTWTWRLKPFKITPILRHLKCSKLLTVQFSNIWQYRCNQINIETWPSKILDVNTVAILMMLTDDCRWRIWTSFDEVILWLENLLFLAMKMNHVFTAPSSVNSDL